MSRNLDADPHAAVTARTASFGTQLLGGEFDSGAFGGAERFSSTPPMTSDGYQTFNPQQRDAVSGEVPAFAPSARDELTVFSGYIRI